MGLPACFAEVKVLGWRRSTSESVEIGQVKG
jgi:hypothetical protein